MIQDAFSVLQERGFVQQCNDLEGLRARLAEGPIHYYVGFDPTRDSLHCGSLMPIMAMAHMQRAGHNPIALIGGGTTMVGDPSGKTEMRELLSEQEIRVNGVGILGQLQRYLRLEAPDPTQPATTPSLGGGRFLNNADWLLSLNYIAFLRDIGRYFRVNEMVRADAYRVRLEREEGLSFIEFNYQLLQAFDFLHLFENQACLLQMGGDDQWSNMLAGTDLIRRKHARPAWCLTFPLLATARGEKMGKTAAGAIWLDAAKTSPYEFFQYWVNTDDRDVARFLAYFTFLPMDEVRALAAHEGAQLNASKQRLAFEVTALAHGREAAEQAMAAAQAAFGGAGDLSALPHSSLPRDRFQTGVPLLDLLVQTGLADSKSAARRLVAQGGAYLNDAVISDPNLLLTATMLDADGALMLRAGKKKYHRVIAEG